MVINVSAGRRPKTVQHIICRCEALAHQRYNVFGSLKVEPTDMRTASVRDHCLFIRGTGRHTELNIIFRVAQ
jgi:hypothetical protein